MYVQGSPSSVRSRLSWPLGQAGLVALAVFVYFRIRGLTQSSAEVAQGDARQIMAFERDLGLDLESKLQSWVAPAETLQTMANWIYVWGHWPAIIVTMLWLVWHHRSVFLRLRDAMLVSGALGMAVFVSYPVAPPRLAGLGMVDTVSENSHAYRRSSPRPSSTSTPRCPACTPGGTCWSASRS
jgi:hypothetical protein